MNILKINGHIIHTVLEVSFSWPFPYPVMHFLLFILHLNISCTSFWTQYMIPPPGSLFYPLGLPPL